MKKITLIIFLTIHLLSCNNQSQLSFELLPVNSEPESGESRLFSNGNDLILSWITVKNGKNHLYFSKFEEEKWGKPQLIISDTSWFVNWADFPNLHIDQANPDFWVTSFMKKSSHETFSYDINYIYSKNGGENWSTPQKLHGDTTLTEHGFISMFNDPEGIGAVWLDGRNTKPGHGHQGAMTLRTGIIDKEGIVVNEQLLDDKICDCCQTAAVKTPSGVIALYRNRSDEEIRDIWMVRKVNGKWTEPESFHDDGWNIPGCPVNGPSIASREDLVAAAWFTAANDSAKVQMKISTDGGEIFSKPISIDHGLPAGRVDITITDKNRIGVSWIENLPQGGAQLQVSFYDAQGNLLKTQTITDINPSRGSGFPQIMAFDGKIVASWTDVDYNTIKSSYSAINF